MQLHRVVWTAAVAAATVVLAGPVAPAGASMPGAPTQTRITTAAVDSTLPFERAYDLAVDPATGRSLVTGGSAASLREADGSEVVSFEELGDAREVVAHDGAYYVLLHDDPAIVVIDPASGREVARWDLGISDQVMGLAVADRRLWTTAAVEEPITSRLVSVDLESGSVAGGAEQDWTLMDLAGSTAHPTLLAGVGRARVREGGDFAVRLIDVVTGEVVARPSVVPFPQDVAFSADGSMVQVAASYTPVLHEYRVPDLSRGRIAYPVGHFPAAIATSSRADGLLAMAARNTSEHSTDLWVFRQGVPAPIADLSLPDDGGRLSPDALSFTSASDGAVVVVEYPSDQGRPAEVVTVPIDPRPGAPTPRVLGTHGGGTIEVAGPALGRSSATIGGQAAPVAWSSSDRLGLRAPPLPAGTAPVMVTNGAALTSPAAAPALVVDLGPHGDARSFADAMARAFLRRPATADEGSAEDARLLAGGEVGALPLELSADPAFSRLRTPLIRLYRAVFLRPPDTAGLSYWLGRMRAGQSIDSVASAFAGTPEFRARYAALSDSAFVDRAYRNVLGRPPDDAGRDHWLGQLRRGASRGRVILQISASPEFRDRIADEVALTNVALGVLGRALTRPELTAALDRVAAGASLASEATRLVRSPGHTEDAR